MVLNALSIMKWMVVLHKYIPSVSLHFNGHFSRWTWVSCYQNVSRVDFIEVKVMDEVLTTGAIAYAKL